MITGKIDPNDMILSINNDSLTVGDNLLTYDPYDSIVIPSSELTLSIDGTIDWRKFNRYDVDVEVVDQNNGSKEKVKTSVSRFNNDIMPDKVIYNGDTTILINDDDKYVVKCSENDKFDPVFGFLYGYFLMNNGMSKTQAAKFFKHLEKCGNVEIPKVKKVEDIMNCKQLSLDDYVKEMKKAMK